MQKQDHGIDKSLDMTTLLAAAAPAIERGEKVYKEFPIRNINRTAGTITGSELTRRHGAQGLPDDTLHFKFFGSAGQSFAAFCPRGMTLEIEGDANDYFGKGMSGGRIVVSPPAGSTFVPEDNIIIGNVALYGATGGEIFCRGQAGERFAVRNSGATAVVESVGDHACEYMTKGLIVVLGKAGRNFAAGMSGGVAYVFDEDGRFPRHCNTGMVELDPIDDGDLTVLRDLIHRHYEYTGSTVAWQILSGWKEATQRFVKVMPVEYRKVLAAAHLDSDDARVAAV
jgi:glutamate synthase (ferredoxin)